MNVLQRTFILSMLLFSVAEGFAQDLYSDPYGVYNGYGPSGYGRRKNMPLTDTSKLSKESQDKLTEETIAKTIDKLKSLLKLDELQQLVIKDKLREAQKKQAAIKAKESSSEEKISSQKAVMETTDRQIMELLYKGQKEKFKALIDER